MASRYAILYGVITIQQPIMTYVCGDCGYRGNKSTNGQCPACGSWNLNSSTAVPTKSKVDKYKKLKMWIMIFAWGVFCFELIRLSLQ